MDAGCAPRLRSPLHPPPAPDATRGVYSPRLRSRLHARARPDAASCPAAPHKTALFFFARSPLYSWTREVLPRLRNPLQPPPVPRCDVGVDDASKSRRPAHNDLQFFFRRFSALFPDAGCTPSSAESLAPPARPQMRFFFFAASPLCSQTRGVLPSSAESLAPPPAPRCDVGVDDASKSRRPAQNGPFFFRAFSALFMDAGCAPPSAESLAPPPAPRCDVGVDDASKSRRPAHNDLKFFFAASPLCSQTRDVLPSSAESLACPRAAASARGAYSPCLRGHSPAPPRPRCASVSRRARRPLRSQFSFCHFVTLSCAPPPVAVILSALAAAARSSLLGRLSSLFIVGLYILHQLPALSPPQSAVPYSLPTPWTLPPLLLCSTSALDDPNDAQRTMSQLSFHESKLAKFLAHRASHPYAKEGPGVCYNVACASNDDIAEYRAGALTGGQFLARLKWKVGHSSDWERRQREYEKCDVGQTHIWVCRWEVDRRYYCERLAQLLQFCEGGKRIVELCACGVHHREYFEFDSVGGFAEFSARMMRVVASMEEAECIFYDPCPSTQDIYELITRPVLAKHTCRPDTKEARTQSELDEGDVRVGSGDDKGGMRVGSGDDKDDMRAGLYIDKGDPRVGFYIDNGDPRVGLYADKGDPWVGFHTDNNTGHQARQDPG
ncbi:hypothetical protein B0H13DRAFT_2336867 [Mycena leptocephala]|nr:hypothetical protein B0H13DRAFT_2336867 [Mycena leptocephala]